MTLRVSSPRFESTIKGCCNCKNALATALFSLLILFSCNAGPSAQGAGWNNNCLPPGWEQGAGGHQSKVCCMAQYNCISVICVYCAMHAFSVICDDRWLMEHPEVSDVSLPENSLLIHRFAVPLPRWGRRTMVPSVAYGKRGCCNCKNALATALFSLLILFSCDSPFYRHHAGQKLSICSLM